MPPSVTSHSVGIAREAALVAVAVVALEEGDAAIRRARERERERGVVCRTRASRSEAARRRRAGTPRPRRSARRSEGCRRRRRAAAATRPPRPRSRGRSRDAADRRASSGRGASDAQAGPRLPPGSRPERARRGGAASRTPTRPRPAGRLRSTKRPQRLRVRVLDDAGVREHDASSAAGVELELARALAHAVDLVPVAAEQLRVGGEAVLARRVGRRRRPARLREDESRRRGRRR